MTTVLEPELTPDQQYRKVERIIHSVVHKYRPLVPDIDREDLLGEAHVAYCVALQEYNPRRGTITTWVYWRVRGAITHLIRRHKRRMAKLTQHEIHENRPAPDDPVQLAATLTGDAGTAARLILRGPRMNPQELADELAFMGWSGERIMNTFTQLRKALR